MGCDCWEHLDNIKKEINAQGDNVANRLTKEKGQNLDETLYGKEKFKSLKEKIQWVCENFSNARKHL